MQFVSSWFAPPKSLQLTCVVDCFLQYSEKEDKYEEEIKLLTDKLKEVMLILVSLGRVSGHFCLTGTHIIIPVLRLFLG